MKILKHNYKKIFLLIILAVFFTNCAHDNLKYSVEEKDKFIKYATALQTSGDSFTKESLLKAEKFLPVLLTLTDDDLKRQGDYNSYIYFFLTLNSQLCYDNNKINEKNSKFFVENFNKIPNSRIKLLWSYIIFTYGTPTNEIVNFLKEANKDPNQKELLKFGWSKEEWEKFEKKLESYKD